MESMIDGSPGTEETIRLSTETGSLSGTAYYRDEDHMDIPAAGATVFLYQDVELYMELTTDENGQYTVPCLPAGEYNLVFSMEGYSDYYLDRVGVYRDQLTSMQDGYFYEKGKITGCVTDAITGEALEGVEVELRVESEQGLQLYYLKGISTDESGTYLMDLSEASETDTDTGTYSGDIITIFTVEFVIHGKKQKPIVNRSEAIWR